MSDSIQDTISSLQNITLENEALKQENALLKLAHGTLSELNEAIAKD